MGKRGKNPMITIKHAITPIIALVLGTAGCQSSTENNSHTQEIKTLTAKIDTIDKKLDRLQNGLAQGKAPPPKRPIVGQLYKVDVSSDDAYRGGKDAKVTIAIASEFACPYCKMLASATDTLLEQYDDDELKLVSKQFVVHPSVATQPALAACAASKQGKFSEYERALWDAAWEGGERPRLVREGLSNASLDAIAGKLKLDMSKFHDDMSGSCKQTIARNRKEMGALGVNGTPAVYINGRYYGGQRTPAALKEAVDKELAAADAALSRGASVEGYYEGVIAKGRTSL